MSGSVHVLSDMEISVTNRVRAKQNNTEESIFFFYPLKNLPSKHLLTLYFPSFDGGDRRLWSGVCVGFGT